MTSPESSPAGRMFIPMGGDNSCGKSALARELSLYVRNPEDGHDPIPTYVVHAGDFFRHMASIPEGFPLDTPEQIRASASVALEHMQCKVNHETGEMYLTNGVDLFKQDVANGQGGAKLGSNPHLAEFVGDVIFGLFDQWLPKNEKGIGLVEGREDWGIDGLAIRVTAPFGVRREFFRQEREEAVHWSIEQVKEKIHLRDTLDAPILAQLKARDTNIIEVTRVDNTESSTRQLAKQIGSILFDYREHPTPFGVMSISG